jgi:hypothetical protein
MTSTSLRRRWRAVAPRHPLALLLGGLLLGLLIAFVSSATAATNAAAPSSLFLPTLSGVAREGATLTADPGTWSGDAPITFTYAWERCDGAGESCVPISRATASLYVIPSSAPGATLRVAVTATNASGSVTALSAVSGVVAPAGTGPANSVLPVVSGPLQQGQILRATSGSWNGTTPLTFAYQWQRCSAAGAACVSIASANGATYPLVATDIGSTVRVAVTAKNSRGLNKAYSAVSEAVVSAHTPAVSTPPVITGSAIEGSPLSVSDGTWVGTAPISYAIQWMRCDIAGSACLEVSGATSGTYTPVAADDGHTLRASVTASNLAGSAVALSAASPVISSSSVDAPANSQAPTISGDAVVGGTLTATTGTWTGSAPLTFMYSWQSCDSSGSNCTTIAGAAAATYSPVLGDLGHKLRVQVVASNTHGAAAAISTASSAVASPKAPYNIALPVIYAASTKLKENDVVTASVGSWLAASSISYTYQWTRCTSSLSCAPIPGAKKVTYTIVKADAGHSIFVLVKAANRYGAAFATSQRTPAGISQQLRIAKAPTITGSPTMGATLTATPGTWVSAQPISYFYQWARCATNGSACKPIAGAKARTYTVSSADKGSRLFVQIKAMSGQASAFANSLRTNPIGALVAPASPATATVQANSVVLPNRLVISNVKFQPRSIGSLAPFTARFRVTDATGHPVQGALVYALGLPYSWVRSAPEVATGSDGWATVQITPTARLPLERGTALVLFVRARKVGDNLLAGVSTRRLVQVVVGSRGLASASSGSILDAPLANGVVPIGGVSLPNRLVISDVKFQPRSIGSHAPFTARFRVTDTSGHPVQGALVYALGLPYSWTYGAPEVATGADGWATVQITPTAQLPLKPGTSLVMFVRARKAGDNLLGGVSNRRLVQIVVR